VGHERLTEVGYDVAVVSHIWSAGCATALAEYLRRRRRSRLLISHPFHRSPPESSFCEGVTSDGRSWRTNSPLPPIAEPYRYVLDFLDTVRWVVRFGPVDVLIGCGNINALAGLLLRRLGRARRVVFYAIDYVPVRFNQRALNLVYHWMERMCAQHSDCVWNVSPAMAAARAEAGIPTESSAPQLEVPVGGGFDLATRASSASDSTTISFVGHLLPKQGLQVIVQALREVLAAVPSVRLLVIGSGPYGDEIRDLAARLGVLPRIDFAGRIDDPNVIYDLLSKSAIGVAPYLRELDTWTRYADPGKIKDYLAAGLPIVTTDVPPIAPLLVDRGAGMIVDPTPAQMGSALTQLLTDRRRRRLMAESAHHLGLEYDWERIFDRAFQQLDAPRAQG